MSYTVLNLKPKYENLDKMEDKTLKEKVELTSLELFGIPFDELPMDTDERSYVHKCVEFKMKSYWSKPVRMRHADIWLQVSWDGQHVKIAKNDKILSVPKNILNGKKVYRKIYVNAKPRKLYTQTLHTLVADAWLEKPESDKDLEINHIDNDKWNSSPWNLEWVTKSENTNHAFIIGSKRPPVVISARKGKDHPMAKYTEDQIRKVCELLKNPKLTYNEISELTNVSHNMIGAIFNGLNWTHISEEYMPFPDRDVNDKISHIGISNGNSKYNEDQVRKVCKKLADPNITYVKIARDVGVSVDTAMSIAKYKSWKHISKDYPKFPDRNLKVMKSHPGESHPRSSYTDKEIILFS